MNIYLIGGVAIIFGAIGYAVYLQNGIRQSTQISKKLIEEAVPYEQHPAVPHMHILVAGDSTGAGVGAGTPQNSIAGRLGKKYPDASIENIAVSGMKLENLLEVLPKRLTATSSYDVILLQIGANDIVGLTGSAKVEKELNQALTLASAHAERVYVITAGNVGLSAVFKFPLRKIYTYRSRVIRQIFMNTVKKYDSAQYVDLFKEAKDEPFNKDIQRFYALDLFHPSGDGYAIWFEQLKKVIEATSSKTHNN